MAAETILILGESGCGKTSSLRNLNPKETFIISTTAKPLPWRGWKKNYTKWDTKDTNNGNLYQTSKCVDIKFDSTKFRIDTDKLDIKKYEEDANGYVNKVSLQLERNNDYKIKFYKTIFDELYDDSYFTVEESNNCN